MAGIWVAVVAGGIAVGVALSTGPEPGPDPGGAPPPLESTPAMLAAPPVPPPAPAAEDAGDAGAGDIDDAPEPPAAAETEESAPILDEVTAPGDMLEDLTKSAPPPAPPPAPPLIDPVEAPPTGQASPEAIQAAIAAAKPAMKACYQQALAQDPATAGRVKVEFEIEAKDGHGIVTRAQIPESETAAPFFESCLLESIVKVKFEPPAGGNGRVVVTYPFTFDPGGGFGGAEKP